jgi:hypothetical protein
MFEMAKFFKQHLWTGRVPHILYVSDVRDEHLNTKVVFSDQSWWDTFLIHYRTYLHRTFRMLPTVAEALRPQTKWIVLADCDSVLFLRNLLRALHGRDWRAPQYLGNWSESPRALRLHGRFAYGGAGVVLSRALLLRVLPCVPRCLLAYARRSFAGAYFSRFLRWVSFLCVRACGSG